MGDKCICYAGETDLIPEMDSIQVEIARLPVSGKHVMTADEAVQAAHKIRPQVVIPMHYGAGVAGTIKGVHRFRD